jgi:subtilisin family serine protease
VALSPGIGKPGQRTEVTAVFGNVAAASEVSALSFSPPGLLVQNIRVPTSSPVVPFAVDVSPTARVGSYNLLVSFRSGGKLQLANAFTVTPIERVLGPRIDAIRPSHLQPGKRYQLEILGKNFAPGMQVDFGQGVEIIGVPLVLSPTQASVQVMIAPSAAPGARSANVSSVDGMNSGPGGLEIVPLGWKRPDAPRDEREVSQVPDQVLAVISIGSPEAMRVIAEDLARIRRLGVLEVIGLRSTGDGLIVFRILDGLTVPQKVAALQTDPRVRLAQPDFLYTVADDQLSNASSVSYGPSLIKSDKLRGHVTGKGITVAIVDTGIDASHKNLQGKVLESVDLTEQHVGYTPDLHGTMVAGIIAAERRNGSGFDGVAPRVQLLAFQSCHARPQELIAGCSTVSLTHGVEQAISKGARVINLSVAGQNHDPKLSAQVEAAVSKGIFVVAAAGNDGPTGRPPFPAALQSVAGVTAVDASSRVYPLATQGLHVALAAPGVEIFSTAPGGKYQVQSGTSFAAAFVSGVAALLLERDPQLTPQKLRDLMKKTAQHLGEPGANAVFGSGLLDACAAAVRLGLSPELCQ